MCSTFILTTTVQAQDFKDTRGDAVVGRKTLPLVYPTVARPVLMLTVTIWSVGLSYLWKLSNKISFIFCAFGILVGWRFVSRNTCKADQRSYYLYNVGSRSRYHYANLTTLLICMKIWVSLAHALPAYYRFKKSFSVLDA